MGAKAKIFIEAEPDEVFHVLTDPELSKQWLQGRVETIPLSGPLDHPGARFKQRFLQGKTWAEYEGHVTAFQKGRLLASELNNGPFLSCGRYEVEPSGAGTILHFSLDFKGKTFAGKILCLGLGLMAKAMCPRQVKELKKFVEERKKA